MTSNAALILAGGMGSRMQQVGLPKQFMLVRERPIIDYCLCTFQEHPMIDSIFIVLDIQWREFMDEWLQKSNIEKFKGYACPGEDRQLSIFNGLKAIQSAEYSAKNVIIHDAARPLVSKRLITDCLEGLDHAEGVMPVLPLKDTCYQSEDGKKISAFLPRNQLFAGQAPEAFHLSAYLAVHKKVGKEYLKQISGSSELAYKNGFHIMMIPGSETNIKITTPQDLLVFEKYLDSGVCV